MQRTEAQLMTYVGRLEGDARQMLTKAATAFDLSVLQIDRWLEGRAELTTDQLVFLNEFSLGYYVRVAGGGNVETANIVRRPPASERKTMTMHDANGTVGEKQPAKSIGEADPNARKVVGFGQGTDTKPYGLAGAPHAGLGAPVGGKRGVDLPDKSTPQGRQELGRLKEAVDASLRHKPKPTGVRRTLSDFGRLIGVGAS